MASGAFVLKVEGIDQLKAGLAGTARGIKDLSAANRAIGRMAADYVRAHEPVGHASSHDSGQHAPAGYLRARTSGGGGKAGAFVQATTEPFHYLIVQEFGGTAFWHQSGAGKLRTAAHRGNVATAQRLGVRGHAIYRKARNPLGYFIWNVAYRIRGPISDAYSMNLEQIAVANGLKLDMQPGNLGLEPMPKPI